MAYQATKRLYLNADKTAVVEESSADAAFLLAGEGCPVDDALVEQYRLEDMVTKYHPAPDLPSARAGLWDWSQEAPRLALGRR